RATAFAVKAFSGKPPSDFFTSRRTFVSLIIDSTRRLRSGLRSQGFERLRIAILAFQNLPVFLGHARMPVRRRYLHATFISVACLIALFSSLVSAREHAVSVTFVV